MFWNGADTKQAESTRLSTICNTSYALVDRNSTVLDNIIALVNYAWVVYLEYRVKIVDVCIRDIVENTLLSQYLPARSCAAITIYYIMASKESYK